MTQGKEKPLLPGCGRSLDYVPCKRDPDYVGDLFPNVLDPDQAAVGYLTYIVP